MKKTTRVLLLVPMGVAAGGIHNWARILLQKKGDSTIEYIVLDTSVRYRTLGGRMGLKEALCAVLDCIVRFFLMVKHLIKDRPDIVYFTCAPSIGFAFRDTPLIALSKLFASQVVIHLRGGNIPGFWGGSFLKQALASTGSRLADYIFVITRECEAYARRRFGSNKVIYIPNFIEADCLDGLKDEMPPKIRQDRFNVIHVAFQCQAKGTFEIIEAAAYLSDEVNILLIGPVADDKKIAIQRAIQKADVQHKVTLVGPQNKPELWHYYRHADVFVFPTYSEGFPNVIMEAMLCRLPIIATDVGNIVEMVDAGGKTPAALILKHADPPQAQEIADLVKRLKEDDTLRNNLAENGFLRVTSQYSSKVIIPALDRILQAIKDGQDVMSIACGFFVQKEI